MKMWRCGDHETQTGCHRLRGQVTSLSFDELVNLYPFFYVTWTFWTFSVFIKNPKPKNGPLSVTAAFCVSAGGASRRWLEEAGCREEGSRPVCEAIPAPYMSLLHIFFFCPDTQVIPRCNTFLNTNMQTHAGRKELNSQQRPSDRGQG